MLLRFLPILFVFSACRCDDDRPRVRTPAGVVVGRHKTSHGGRKFAAYEGIPFARPPIGKRRFEPPEIQKPWPGEWDASFLTSCAQSGSNGTVRGVEDCLYINLYTPNLEPHWEDNYPVIVHIHGGAFMYGSGQLADPTYVMDKDVVFITFNYRLGILGFLSTEDDVVPGNTGLKDQVRALEWIQHHILSFGGDPASITLTGLSAGGASVHYHYLSPLSKGLFHKGFSQSGVALNPWALQEKPLEQAQRLAESLGCPSKPSKDLVKCLKQKPVEQLLGKLPVFFGYQWLPLTPFGPVVEKGGKKPFISEDPYVLMHKSKVKDLPWLVSTTADEGFFLYQTLKSDIDTFLGNWETWAPILLDYNYTLPQKSRKVVADKIKEFYLGDTQPVTEEKFFKIFSDRIITVGVENAARLQSQVAKSPVYYYSFNYPGDSEEKTVMHGGDIKYLFGDFLQPGPLTENELKMKDVAVELLHSFATTGKPKIEGVDWEPTKSNKLTYLEINGFEPKDNVQRVVEELSPREFWKSLNFAENEHLVLIKDEL